LIKTFALSLSKIVSITSSMKRIVFFLTLFLVSENMILLRAAPYHTITVDGDLSDWQNDEIVASDGVDSVWNPAEGTNEIKNIYATWNETDLFIAIEGIATDKGILLYLDSSQSRGFGDLRELRTWNRRVSFAGDFAPDFFFAAWGSSSDGNFYKLSSSSTADDFTSKCGVKAPALNSKKYGWEIKIPWDLIYSRGNFVPYDIKIKCFVSLATGDVGSSDFGSYGYLGGDCVPDDKITGLGDVVISTWVVIAPDKNSDGVPDNNFKDVALAFKSVTVVPVRFVPSMGGGSTASITVETTKEASVSAGIYDIAGRKIKTLSESAASNGFLKNFLWDGRYDSGNSAPAGVYIISIRASNGAESVRINKAIVVIR